MSYNCLPDRNLEPPELDLRIAFSCELCEGPIYEGEDYYDIPGLGYCCEKCIDDHHCCDAEVDDNSDAAYESMREEAMLNE